MLTGSLSARSLAQGRGLSPVLVSSAPLGLGGPLCLLLPGLCPGVQGCVRGSEEHALLGRRHPGCGSFLR